MKDFFLKVGNVGIASGIGTGIADTRRQSINPARDNIVPKRK